MASPWLIALLLPLATVYWFSHKSIGPQPLFWILLIGIVGSALIAIPVSHYSGANTYATLALAFFTIALAGLYLVDHGPQILALLVPYAYVDAIVSLWQVNVMQSSRAEGLVFNTNANAAFLGLMAIYLLHSPKYRWFALPLLVSVAFTGSRWAALVVVVVCVAMLAKRMLSWRFAAALVAVGILIIAVSWHTLTEGFRVFQDQGYQPTANVQIVNRAQADTWTRLKPPHVEWWNLVVPSGFRDSELHNVPLRMAVETGLLSALTWLGVTIWSLWRGPRDASWWMLLTLGLLSMLYYHVWLAPLGGLWWLLIGMRTKPTSVSRSG